AGFRLPGLRLPGAGAVDVPGDEPFLADSLEAVLHEAVRDVRHVRGAVEDRELLLAGPDLAAEDLDRARVARADQHRAAALVVVAEHREHLLHRPDLAREAPLRGAPPGLAAARRRRRVRVAAPFAFGPFRRLVVALLLDAPRGSHHLDQCREQRFAALAPEA